ncbi:MAG: peptidoglycan editing factor PgeF [Myxococcales bacterium]
MLIQSKRLSILHAFSTREGGVSEGPFASLNLGRSVGDAPERVAENARRFAQELGLTPGQLVSANQVHGETLLEVTSAQPGPVVPAAIGDADALFTRTRGVALGIRTADCVPVLVHAPDVGAIAAIHAGWRGSVVGIAGKAVVRLKEQYGADPRKMIAVIGPHIRSCCYEVSPEVAGRFEARFGAGLAAPGGEGKAGPMLDLETANRRALAEAGIVPENLEALPECTSCHPQRFFSHRRDQGRSGRHLSVLALV